MGMGGTPSLWPGGSALREGGIGMLVLCHASCARMHWGEDEKSYNRTKVEGACDKQGAKSYAGSILRARQVPCSTTAAGLTDLTQIKSCLGRA